MDLTKYAHATVMLTKDGTSVVLDPGTLTPGAADLVRLSAAVLVTHDHPDHFDRPLVEAALEAQPELRVYAPVSIVATLTAHADRVVGVTASDSFDVAGFSVSVFGAHHAVVHAEIPVSDNVGYLVDGNVYHPGDAYTVPTAEVTTLLVPTGGPWVRIGDAVDFIRAVHPKRTIQIHDLPLSDAGRTSSAHIVEMLTGMPLITLHPGDALTV
jgi:L-ascorbate metabolism protein UlaG (beta-lactamase superfamily)